MSFFSKIFKNKIFRAVVPVVLGAINPALGAAAGAAMGASNGGGIVGGLTGAAGGYFGGSALSGGISGAAGGAGFLNGAGLGLNGATSALGGALGISGGTISNASNIFQALGGISSMAPQKQTLAKQKVSGPTTGTEKPFTPKKPDAQMRPPSLNAMAGFSPEQERSALATQGLNSGLGDQEQSYYQNLIQRSLIGDGGEVNTENPNWLMPIESSYFSRRGKNTSNISEFLRGFA